MKLFELDGEVAFVTGAGTGIGQAIAVGLAQAGADVACFGRRTNAGLQETAAKIEAEGRKSLIVHGSVTSKDEVVRAVALTEEKLGPISIAVNNAGTAGSEPAEDMSLAEWQRLYDTNVTGVFLSCQAEAKAMLPRGKGSIINISSINATITVRGVTQVHYDSAKAAVSQLSKTLAVEWAERGIRVNAISPGFTMTKMNDRPEVAQQLKQFQRDTPMNRIASPEQMVGPAVFLAAQASSFVTGVDLVVDGGFVCW